LPIFRHKNTQRLPLNTSIYPRKHPKEYFPIAQQVAKTPKGKQKTTAAELKKITQEITGVLQDNLHIFVNAQNAKKALTGKERQRLYGAGVKNFGFIEKAFEIARANPGFAPPHLNVGELRNWQDDLEELRQLFLSVEQFAQAAYICYLQRSDMCYRTALRIYAGLKEQEKGRVDGAAPLYEVLKPFFRRRKRQTGTPTQKQSIRNSKKLIQGKADGEMIIKNESHHVTGGLHEVVDNVQKEKRREKREEIKNM
jgi:hypothetical protein